MTLTLMIAGYLMGCSTPYCVEVKRPSCQYVCIQQCKPLVEYQGTSFGIKGINIPIPQTGTTVNIGDTSWSKTILQTAASTSQVPDIQRISRYDRLAVIASSITDQKEYEQLLKQMYENEEKINQLALLITMNNPTAVVNWINAYSTEISPAAISTALADEHSNKAQPMVRSLNHQIYIPKNVKVRSLDSLTE
jgi:hypothetical protein